MHAVCNIIENSRSVRKSSSIIIISAIFLLGLYIGFYNCFIGKMAELSKQGTVLVTMCTSTYIELKFIIIDIHLHRAYEIRAPLD